MSLSNFALTKSWESAADFPTFEEDEAQVRADMQCLFAELEVGLQKLITELQKKNTGNGSSGATNIGIDAIVGLTGVTDVQSALAMLVDAINNVSVGTLQDHSVTNAKLSRKTDTDGASVKQENIAAGAVDTTELAAGAVTGAKTDFSAGLNISGALTTDDATLGGKIFLSADSYGNSLPATAEAGRLFFLKAT